MNSIGFHARAAVAIALAISVAPVFAADGALPAMAPATWLEQAPTTSTGIAPASEKAVRERFGASLAATSLDALRGGNVGSDNRNNVNGRVSDNVADDVVSGENTLGGNAFAGASGISTVIQNSGSNVLIQNATIVNVQFADPSP